MVAGGGHLVAGGGGGGGQKCNQRNNFQRRNQKNTHLQPKKRPQGCIYPLLSGCGLFNHFIHFWLSQFAVYSFVTSLKNYQNLDLFLSNVFLFNKKSWWGYLIYGGSGGEGISRRGDELLTRFRKISTRNSNLYMFWGRVRPLYISLK